MAWKTLGDALETAIAMGMESGEMGVDAPSRPKSAKSAGAKAPASVTGQRQTTGEVVDYANAGEGSRAPSIMDRCMTTARRTTGLPTRSAVVIHLDMYRKRHHATSP